MTADLTTPDFFKNAKSMSLEDMVKAAPDGGLYMEFGVHTGGTIARIANSTTSKVYGFDSFKGLPEFWGDEGLAAGTFACDIPKELPTNVELVVGWYNDTLPTFVKENKDTPISFIHIDCDLYSSTKCIFDNFENNFRVGSVIAFDEIVYPQRAAWAAEEHKAFEEFLLRTRYTCEVLGKQIFNGVGFYLTEKN